MKDDTLHSAKFLRAHQRTKEPLVDDGEAGIVHLFDDTDTCPYDKCVTACTEGDTQFI